MSHTDTRHGRQITITGCGRQGIRVEALNRHVGAYLLRGWIRSVDISDGHTVRRPVTYEHEWLDEMCGDFVDAEAALLAATAELDH